MKLNDETCYGPVVEQVFWEKRHRKSGDSAQSARRGPSPPPVGSCSRPRREPGSQPIDSAADRFLHLGPRWITIRTSRASRGRSATGQAAATVRSTGARTCAKSGAAARHGGEGPGGGRGSSVPGAGVASGGTRVRGAAFFQSRVCTCTCTCTHHSRTCRWRRRGRLPACYREGGWSSSRTIQRPPSDPFSSASCSTNCNPIEP